MTELGSIVAVTINSPDIARVEAAYTEYLGYRVVAHERFDPSLAASWGAPKAAGRPTVILAPPTDEKVMLRFVQSPHLPYVRPHSTYGWNVIEINAGEVDGLVGRLAGSPFKHVAGPANLPMNENIRAFQATGPDGELLYFTQVNPSPTTGHLPQIARGVGRVFIMVLGVGNIAAIGQFYAQTLGRAMTPRISFASPLIAAALDQPPDHQFGMGLVRLPGKYTLEIDDLGNIAKPRIVPEDDLMPGICAVSFAVPSIDPALIGTVAPPRSFASPPYDGARAALVHGPSGEWIELIEHV